MASDIEIDAAYYESRGAHADWQNALNEWQWELLSFERSEAVLSTHAYADAATRVYRETRQA